MTLCRKTIGECSQPAGMLLYTCAAEMQHAYGSMPAVNCTSYSHTYNSTDLVHFKRLHSSAIRSEPWAQQPQQMLQKWLALGLCGAQGSGRLGPGQPSSDCAAAPLNSCQLPRGDGTADPWSHLQHLKQPQYALPLLAAPAITPCLMLSFLNESSSIDFGTAQKFTF